MLWATTALIQTYVAGDDAVHLGLLDEWGVTWQRVTSGHGALAGLLVPILREANTVFVNICLTFTQFGKVFIPANAWQR